jgi:alpha-N-acetylglucosamine transferase
MGKDQSDRPPRLKLNDVEIGLRHTGDQVYVPKNIQILKDVFYKKDIANEFFSQNVFYENPISKIQPEKYHHIESFCFVATENVKEEAELLLSSLRLFHKQPVYLICDDATKKHLQQKKLTKNVNFKLGATKEKLDKIQKNNFDNHVCIANQIHHAPAILKKMDVMIWALKECNNTFFLDSDIIVLNSLQEYFTSSVVLSPHYYAENKIHKGFEFGFYNAGYVFCANKGFPNTGSTNI